MMGCRSRDVVLTCLLIGLLIWSADARTPGGSKESKENKKKSTLTKDKAPMESSGGVPSAATPEASPTTPEASPATPEASPVTPGTADPQGTLFDVTKYGAVGDGKTDNNKAFAAAWAAVCKSSSTGPSTFLVPRGDFLLSPIIFAGPCSDKALSPSVIIRGKLIASTSDSSASKGWITFQNLGQLHVSGAGTGSLDGKGETAWANGCRHSANTQCSLPPANLKLEGITGGSLNDIISVNSQGFHFHISNSKDFNIHDFKINAPGFSPNTDGLHISNSASVSITNAEIGTGDDCVSIGAGTSNISVTNVICGPGHGISVGSLGKYPNEKEVNGLLVKNCTLASTTNGVRIKTWPGSPDNTVTNVRFEDITLTNVSNPIIINQNYCDKKACESTPSRVKLTDIHFKNIKGTTFGKTGVTLTCSKGVPCEKVELVDIDLKPSTAAGDLASTCENVNGVTTTGVLNPKPPCA
ncbi:exopolygalacturonase-like [Macadamia integrifolia]|uniref:exopolygalacturonase-like n=1 Tax=Macadamia integrifolia TaxID=60698 RepID=UPI001C4EF547|nr:exopolygalacturonase-like [Macadamia integrifolia]